jgi:hypothetical protein
MGASSDHDLASCPRFGTAPDPGVPGSTGRLRGRRTVKCSCWLDCSSSGVMRPRLASSTLTTSSGTGGIISGGGSGAGGGNGMLMALPRPQNPVYHAARSRRSESPRNTSATATPRSQPAATTTRPLRLDRSALGHSSCHPARHWTHIVRPGRRRRRTGPKSPCSRCPGGRPPPAPATARIVRRR